MRLLMILFLSTLATKVLAEEATVTSASLATATSGSVAAAAPQKTIVLPDLCVDSLKGFPGKYDASLLKAACSRVSVLDECQSVDGTPIFHYERVGNHKAKQKILVYSLIHGDETAAGTVGRLWMERLESIEPRNSWRVVPILNPDGVKLKTRTNAHKIDINRNFPTQDWDAKAKDYWHKETKSNPRRFPGDKANSEPETACALKHIEDFKPDFVVSIHTPLKVLDFDGPKVAPPKFDYLPWKSLGHYPGSLGRYMWFERKTPVLTMELKEDLPKNAKPFVELQDIIGLLVSLELQQKQHPRQADKSKKAEKTSAILKNEKSEN